MKTKTETKQLSTPVAILIAGVLIAAAVLVSSRFQDQTPTHIGENPVVINEEQVKEDLLDRVNEITAEDHIRGSQNPKVTIVEYSDFDCPFCSRFHGTMQRVIENYGQDVAWVYRHFPLDSHPDAGPKAMATECVANQLGSDGFWKASDLVFSGDVQSKHSDLGGQLSYIGESLGVDMGIYQTCIDNLSTKDKVNKDLANAVETGGRGTPWSILILEDGTKIPLNGAQPYEAISALVESVISE